MTSDSSTAEIIRLATEIADKAEEQLAEIRTLQARGMSVVGAGGAQQLTDELERQIAVNRNLAASLSDTPDESL